MAIENVNMAAKAAQPAVISIAVRNSDAQAYLALPPERVAAVVCCQGIGLLPRRRSAATAVMLPSSASGCRVAAATTPLQQRSRQPQLERKPYPHRKVVVLDDDINTFVHVVDCLLRYVPAMTPDRAWELAHQIDGQGAAVVWCGPQEQAELIHQQLGAEGLTMAPLEAA